MTITIETITHAPFNANSYIIHKQGSTDAFLVDCGRNCTAIKQYLDDNSLEYEDVLHTHAFIECLEGQPTLRETDDLIAHMSPMDEFWLAHLDTQAIVLNVETVPQAFVDQQVLHDDKLICAGLDVHVIETPGISPGSITYYVPEANAAFVGDVIRDGGLGPLDLPYTSAKNLRDSIEQRLLTLPEDTMLYPSRGPAMAVSQLKNLAVPA